MKRRVNKRLRRVGKAIAQGRQRQRTGVVHVHGRTPEEIEQELRALGIDPRPNPNAQVGVFVLSRPLSMEEWLTNSRQLHEKSNTMNSGEQKNESGNAN